MKHKHIIACLCYSLTCMASCQVENNELPLPTAELSMHIVAQIEGTAPVKSRYGGNSPTLATFQQKDSIGIFVDKEPVVRWEYNGELWTPEEKAYFEQNARTQITLWGNKNAAKFLRDYAAREWQGMLEDFYKPRWKRFLSRLENSLITGKKLPKIDNYREEVGFVKEMKTEIRKMLNVYDVED